MATLLLLQLLGLQGRRSYTDSEVSSAYDDLILAPMEEGYSEAVLAGRAELLNAAREQVIGLKGKPNKDPTAVVPLAMLPSALVILVEVRRRGPRLPCPVLAAQDLGPGPAALAAALAAACAHGADAAALWPCRGPPQVGQYATVLSYGPQLLANWELRKEYRRDVLLTLALARCGLASEMFADARQAHVAEGCAHMEQALQLLQGAGSPALAPGLARDIMQGLEGLKAPRTLDLLKAPLPEDASGVQARQRAVAELSALLSASAMGGCQGRAGRPAACPRAACRLKQRGPPPAGEQLAAASCVLLQGRGVGLERLRALPPPPLLQASRSRR
jgi:hypothetical protein